jgi:hypothetical protein
MEEEEIEKQVKEDLKKSDSRYRIKQTRDESYSISEDAEPWIDMRAAIDFSSFVQKSKPKKPDFANIYSTSNLYGSELMNYIGNEEKSGSKEIASRAINRTIDWFKADTGTDEFDIDNKTDVEKFQVWVNKILGGNYIKVDGYWGTNTALGAASIYRVEDSDVNEQWQKEMRSKYLNAKNAVNMYIGEGKSKRGRYELRKDVQHHVGDMVFDFDDYMYILGRYKGDDGKDRATTLGFVLDKNNPGGFLIPLKEGTTNKGVWVRYNPDPESNKIYDSVSQTEVDESLNYTEKETAKRKKKGKPIYRYFYRNVDFDNIFNRELLESVEKEKNGEASKGAKGEVEEKIKIEKREPLKQEPLKQPKKMSFGGYNWRDDVSSLNPDDVANIILYGRPKKTRTKNKISTMTYPSEVIYPETEKIEDERAKEREDVKEETKSKRELRKEISSLKNQKAEIDAMIKAGNEENLQHGVDLFRQYFGDIKHKMSNDEIGDTVLALLDIEHNGPEYLQALRNAAPEYGYAPISAMVKGTLKHDYLQFKANELKHGGFLKLPDIRPTTDAKKIIRFYDLLKI